jgi:hypothetical protein
LLSGLLEVVQPGMALIELYALLAAGPAVWLRQMADVECIPNGVLFAAVPAVESDNTGVKPAYDSQADSQAVFGCPRWLLANRPAMWLC